MYVFSLNDVPTNFTSRIDIYDKLIKDLNVAKELCPELTPLNKTKFTKQYAYALLGRIAMEAASYQTYRLDVTDASRLEKHPDYTDINNATYARPTNYKSYYEPLVTASAPMLSAVPLPVLTSSVYVSHTVRLVSTPPSTMVCLIPKTYVATSLAPLQVLI